MKHSQRTANCPSPCHGKKPNVFDRLLVYLPFLRLVFSFPFFSLPARPARSLSLSVPFPSDDFSRVLPLAGFLPLFPSPRSERKLLPVVAYGSRLQSRVQLLVFVPGQSCPMKPRLFSWARRCVMRLRESRLASRRRFFPPARFLNYRVSARARPCFLECCITLGNLALLGRPFTRVINSRDPDRPEFLAVQRRA